MRSYIKGFAASGRLRSTALFPPEKNITLPTPVMPVADCRPTKVQEDKCVLFYIMTLKLPMNFLGKMDTASLNMLLLEKGNCTSSSAL